MTVLEGGAGEVPIATVVIPTLDRPHLADRAIRSALAQTVAGVEVVVVDDGSTPAFVPEIDDPRVRLVRRERAGGVSAARNAGLQVARGEWVTFLDDDDVLLPEMLEQSIAAARASTLPGPVAVWSTMELRAPDGSIEGYCEPPTLARGEDYVLTGGGSFRAHNTLVLPTSVAREIGGFDERIEVFQSDDFGLRLNQAASIVAIDAVLYRLVHHTDDRLTARWAAIARDMELTIAAHPAAFARHQRRHARYMARLGTYHLRAGHWREAVRWSRRALVRDRFRRREWGTFAAALAGPRAVAAYRRLREWRRVVTRPEAGVDVGTLTRRRLRKYWSRALDFPRAAVSAPLSWMTWAMIRRRRPGLAAVRSRPVLVLSVYRARNAAILAPAVEDACAHGWDVRLWALDEVAPELAPWTSGSGPGAKFPLLNALVTSTDVARFDWIVVVDDDVELRPGSLARLFAIAEHAGLDLVQPAHTELSHRTFPITERRPLTVARRTSYVEIGPVFAVRRPWIERVVPFPAHHDMGWGLELEWFDLAREGARLGVVDSMAVRHLGPVGRGYRWRDEYARIEHDVEARGLDSFRDIQQTLGTWRPWQTDAPWHRAS